MKRVPTVWGRLVGLAMAGVFMLSAVMSGTMAWTDYQQHKTNVAEGNGPPMPADALLQKYETGTQTPVPGARFGLYKLGANGMAVLLETYITGADGQILASDLLPGSYYWQETRPAPGYLPEIEDGQAKKYPFTVPGEGDQSVRVVAYNTRSRGHLIITKTVTGEGADLTREFSFTAVIGGVTHTFTLRHGQQKVFEDIPVGTTYTVTEAHVTGYTITSENHAGDIPEGGVTAAFTNTYAVTQPQLGSLTVTKTVTGDGADLDLDFDFTAVIGGAEHNFTLKHGQSKTFTDLPLGTAYTVTETEVERYMANHLQYSGTITAASQIVTLPFVNHYEGDNPPDLPGSLEITKTIAGPSPDPDKAFSFTVTFEGEGAPDSPQTFFLKHGEKKTFGDIPRGVRYTVAEAPIEGYRPDFATASGTISSNQTAAVNFINRRQSGDPEEYEITVTKRVLGNPPAADSEKPFHFTLTINGTPHEFSLKSGQTSEPFIVQTGDVYSLAEQDSTGYVKSGVVNGYGTVGSVNIEIIQTNTYTGPETIDIEGEKTWWEAGTTLPSSVTILLKNGNVTVRSITTDQSKNWRYKFENLPKHDALGNVINYTVEEVRIPGWRPVVTGYDIKNQHQPPLRDTEVIEVEKAVTGTPPADAQFKFILTAVNNAPMPGNSEITITGAGKARFGQIDYEVPGIFTYTIAEIDGKLANWSYDASVYTLTITVTEDEDGQLKAEKALTKAGQAAEKALFTNRYDESGETISVKVTKRWQGEGSHPQSVQVRLYRDGTAYGEPTSLSSANNWTRTWTGLEKGHTWTVDEVAVPEGYAKTISGDAVNGFTITNAKQALSPGSIRVTKAWAGEGPHPQSVQAQLYRDGTAYGSAVTLSAANNWRHTWTGLDITRTWTVDEPAVPEGYSKAISGSAAIGFTITNSKNVIVPPGSIRVAKAWAGEDPHPQSVQVQLYRDGTAFGAPATLSTANNWIYTWSDLAEGHTWTVDEPDVPAGYIKAISGSASGGFTITNTRGGGPGETTSVKVTKVWKGEDANRPASIAIQLYKGGVASGLPVILSETNQWTYTWAQLEKGPNYTADEVNVPTDYLKAVTGDAANGFVITNTKLTIPDQPGHLEVSKTVAGQNPDAGKAFTFTVSFAGQGAPASPQSFSLKHGEKKTFSNVPRGVAYTVTEAPDNDYAPDFAAITGTIAMGQTAKAEFTNRKKSEAGDGGLTVTKAVTGEGANRDLDFSFTAVIGGAEHKFSLKHGQSKTFAGIPKGTAYTVTEAESETYAATIKQYSGTVQAAITLPFVNHFEGGPAGPGEITISGKKTWNHGANPEANWPKNITVIIMADNIIVAQRLSSAESWSWSFKLPKVDAAGKEIKYTVDEAEVAGYIKTVDGWNLINTFIALPGTDDPGRPGPKTDDESNLVLWLILMALSLAGLAAVVVISITRRKKRREEEIRFSSLL